MFIKIFTKLKEYLIKKRAEPREASYLFENKEIFNATEEELENVIKEMAAKEIPNSIARDREMIRAVVVTNIQNQRFIKSIENRNFVLTLIVIVLAVISIYLARLQVAPVLLEQERSERRAYEICKNNPDGVYTSVSGAENKCGEVIDVLKQKFE